MKWVGVGGVAGVQCSGRAEPQGTMEQRTRTMN